MSANSIANSCDYSITDSQLMLLSFENSDYSELHSEDTIQSTHSDEGFEIRDNDEENADLSPKSPGPSPKSPKENRFGERFGTHFNPKKVYQGLKGDNKKQRTSSILVIVILLLLIGLGSGLGIWGCCRNAKKDNIDENNYDIVVQNKDMKKFEKVPAPLSKFLALTPGLAHHENDGTTNKIFMVLIPKTKNLMEFRALRKQPEYKAKLVKQPDGTYQTVRSVEAWKALDTLEGKVPKWYPSGPDAALSEPQDRFLEQMVPAEGAFSADDGINTNPQKMQELAKQCIDWNKLQTMKLNKETVWESDRLVNYVAKRWCETSKKAFEETQTDNMDDCIKVARQRRENVNMENESIDKVPALEKFTKTWKNAVDSNNEACRRFEQFDWEVDVFVARPETERSAREHSHPMPLITMTLPIYKDGRGRALEDISVPSIVTEGDEDSEEK